MQTLPQTPPTVPETLLEMVDQQQLSALGKSAQEIYEELAIADERHVPVLPARPIIDGTGGQDGSFTRRFLEKEEEK